MPHPLHRAICNIVFAHLVDAFFACSRACALAFLGFYRRARTWAVFVSARITGSRVYILAVTSATHLLFILLFDNVNALARSGDRIDRRAGCRAKTSCLCHIESCLNAAFEAAAVILIARPQHQLELRAIM